MAQDLQELLARVRALERALDLVVSADDANGLAPRAHSFRVTVRGGTVYVDAGWRKIVGSDWAAVAAKTFEYATGSAVWMKLTYTEGDTAAAWSDLSYGTPDAEDTSACVVVLAETADSYPGKVYQRHFGDVALFDLKNCVETEE